MQFTSKGVLTLCSLVLVFGMVMGVTGYMAYEDLKGKREMEFLIRQQDNNIKQLQNDLLDYNKLNEKGYKEVKK